MQTPEEQLTEIQTAISQIITGAQEVWYNGQRVRKADLATLENRENTLLRRVRRKSRSGIRVRNITPYE